MNVRLFRRKIRGFTLIEMLVAIFCIALITLAVLSMMAMSDKVSRNAEARSAAMSIARFELEKLSSQSQATRLAGSNMTFTIPQSVAQQFPMAAAMKMKGTYSIENVNGKSDLQKISVIVTWGSLSTNGPKTKTSRIVLSTLAANSATGQETNPDGAIASTFVPPPPPPPPPSSGTGGSSTGGGSGGGGSTNTGGSTSGSGSGSSGSSSSGTTAGSVFNLYGGMWGLFYPTSLLP